MAHTEKTKERGPCERKAVTHSKGGSVTIYPDKETKNATKKGARP